MEIVLKLIFFWLCMLVSYVIHESLGRFFVYARFHTDASRAMALHRDHRGSYIFAVWQYFYAYYIFLFCYVLYVSQVSSLISQLLS